MNSFVSIQNSKINFFLPGRFRPSQSAPGSFSPTLSRIGLFSEVCRIGKCAVRGLVLLSVERKSNEKGVREAKIEKHTETSEISEAKKHSVTRTDDRINADTYLLSSAELSGCSWCVYSVERRTAAVGHEGTAQEHLCIAAASALSRAHLVCCAASS